MIQKIFGVLFCSTVVFSLAFAQPQRQAENWHFGKGISISFANGTPQLNGPSAMDAFEGIVSLSDTSGNLLFYTNGGGRPPGNGGPGGNDQSPGIIWNRNHEVMYDMRGAEGGGFSARQSSIAMPDPAGQAGIYYLFTMEEAEFDIGGAITGQPQGRGLSFFTIDMNANGGLGAVPFPDQRIITPAYEGLDATPMANGNGYWLACHNDNAANSQIIIVPLTASGVGTPVTFNQDVLVGGQLVFSPNGQWLYHAGRLLEFDNATGIVGPPAFTFPNASTAACFTPDSRFLYYTEGRPALGEIIIRYDLSDFSTIDVERLSTTANETVLQIAGFQIGPNDNIYFIEERLGTQNPAYGLSEITCVSGPVPSVTRLLLDLARPGDETFRPQSLPNYVDAIFQRPEVADTLVLDTLATFGCPERGLTLRPQEAGTNFLWSDGSTADSLLVTQPGEYCVTITGGCQPTIDCREVSILSPEVTGTITEEIDNGCDGLTYNYVFTTELPILSGTVTYSAMDGQAPYRTIALSGSDTILLPAPNQAETDEVIILISNQCGDTTIPVDFSSFSDERFVPYFMVESTAELCSGLEFSLEVINDGALAISAVRWSDGNTDNPRTFFADPRAEYLATVVNECGDSTDLRFTESIAEVCDCQGRIPEVITPNGDGTNDIFRLFSNCAAEDYTLMVFNRWGQTVFESNNPNQGWDGEKDGTPQNMDTYLYRMVFRLPGVDELQIREGQFSLVR
ncbi:MAG: gliding motility-associated C-terminal domain-containing protein [Bacteroidota bacterium]